MAVGLGRTTPWSDDIDRGAGLARCGYLCDLAADFLHGSDVVDLSYCKRDKVLALRSLAQNPLRKPPRRSMAAESHSHMAVAVVRSLLLHGTS